MNNYTHLYTSSKIIRYILFQRTEYLALQYTNLYKKTHLVAPNITYRTCIFLESLFRKKKISARYTEALLKEYATIEKHLPEKCENILDIGCGVGGIDIFLSRHYPECVCHLLDKSSVNKKVFYGFNQLGAFYNSLPLAIHFLQKNRVSARQINTIEVGSHYTIPPLPQLDIVISLISWGYHYPVTMYLEPVYNQLLPGGRLILDVRKKTNGLEEIKNYFTYTEVIEESSKHQKILAIKE